MVTIAKRQNIEMTAPEFMCFSFGLSVHVVYLCGNTGKTLKPTDNAPETGDLI